MSFGSCPLFLLAPSSQEPLDNGAMKFLGLCCVLRTRQGRARRSKWCRNVLILFCFKGQSGIAYYMSVYLNHYFMCVQRNLRRPRWRLGILAVGFFLIYSQAGERIGEQFRRNIAIQHGVVARLPACERMYSRPMTIHHGIFVPARHVLVSPTYPPEIGKESRSGLL